jgi:signal transduction histidine kinase
LRTPLHGAQLHLEAFLEDSSLGAAQRQKYITPAICSLKLQSYIINDIIDFCEMSSDMLRINLSLFSLSRLIDDLQAIFKPIIASKDLTIQLTCSDNLPQRILND